ncbi:MAG: alcohol dehydrogenase catalytic domain-containing protein, partial [Gordonia sp. (in: high G+C Gram-positive bacteria)]|uniref:alcohol dehydrogenase catalytic domain-containing protein n=1 Tax=Gordonia sp. (in: high G+C Gram-positive bacteria) TaxID=84139 RepID=UPI003BB80ABA
MTPSTARQAFATSYGEPAECVEVRSVEVGVPGPGEVLVRVGAAGVNPFDAKQVRGQVGADENKLPIPLGGEAAGTVA